MTLCDLLVLEASSAAKRRGGQVKLGDGLAHYANNVSVLFNQFYSNVEWNFTNE